MYVCVILSCLCLRKTQVMDYEISYTWAGSLSHSTWEGDSQVLSTLKGYPKALVRHTRSSRQAVLRDEPFSVCGASKSSQDRENELDLRTEEQKAFLSFSFPYC